MKARFRILLVLAVLGIALATGCETESQADEENRARIEEMARTGIEPVREVEDMQRELAESEDE